MELHKTPVWYRTLETIGCLSLPFAVVGVFLSQRDFYEENWLWLIPMAVGGWLVADFLSGLIHWLADNFGNEQTPILGPSVIQPFREHHIVPFKMTTHDFIQTNGSLYLAASLLLGFSILLDPWLQMILSLSALWISQTNQIHKWAHSKPEDRPRWVEILMKWGVLLSPQRHARHHGGGSGEWRQGAYCITSGFWDSVVRKLQGNR